MAMPVDEIQIGMAYQISDDERTEYSLYFTQLPLIQISTTNTIVDEPKVHAIFKMIESNSNLITSDIGIEIRGGATQYLYSKKSYKIVFREDSTGKNNKDVSLLGMRSDDDWDLQAMANEPLRMNEKTSFDIWRKVNSLHYQSSEKDAINSCRMKYAELFLNEEYQGIYCVSEPIDRKQLKLKKYAEDKGIRGELYKGHGWGPTIFSNCPPYNNSSFSWIDGNGYGFDCTYPNEIYPDWKPLYDFVHLVKYASEEDFRSQYENYFNRENAIDYFIFLNFSRALDNTGKNLFIAKYDAKTLYFYVPWDLDATFGNSWDGTQANITNDILSNGFYNRLMNDYAGNGFKQRVKTKWNQLRNDWLTTLNLMDIFHGNYDYLFQNGVYEREVMIWEEKDKYHFDSQYLEYMSEWITNRLKYLDKTFNETTNIIDKQNMEIQCPCDVHIYNINGYLIKSIHLNSISDNLLYSNLNKGIYLMHFQNTKQHKIQKMIIP
jgi:spore coat protein CotH